MSTLLAPEMFILCSVLVSERVRRCKDRFHW